MRLKRILNYILPFIYIGFLTLIINIYGINDLEDYSHGLFTAKIYWENLSNFFIFFYDFNGPGVRFPIGNGPFFHPLNFFLFDLKIFYTLFVFTHLYIQFYFTKKLFKVFKIENNSFLLSIILVFNLPNLNYILSDDWIGAFFSYSLFPAIFYYFVKIINKNYFSDYYKITILTTLWILNGHSGIIAVYILFLFFYFLFSVENILKIKKIFNFHFFFSIIVLILLLSDHLYFLINELLNSTSNRLIQASYSKRPFVEIFFPLENFLSWTKLNRLPGNPIIIYFSLFISIYTIFNLIKKKILNKISLINFFNFFLKIHAYAVKNIRFKFSLLFILFLFFSTSSVLKYTYLISGIWVCRDIFLYVGIFLIFDFCKNFNFNKKFLIYGLIVFYSLFFLTLNLNSIIKKNENNFIINKVSKSDFINKLSDLNEKKNNYHRVYLSKGLYPFLLHGYENDGIFSTTDLIDFNIAPFNGHFKNNTIEGFGDQLYTLNGWIDSSFHLINNEFFLDLYRIKYLLITEKELNNLKNKNFNQVSKITTSKNILKKELNTLEALEIDLDKSFSKEKIYIFERKISNLALSKVNFNKFLKNTSSCDVNKLKCILDNEKLFHKSDHQLNRITNAKFEIKNYSDGDYIFLPFKHEKNWKIDYGKIYEFQKFGMFFHNKTNKINQTYELKYKDDYRLILRILFLITFFLYFIFYFYLKKNFLKITLIK